MQADTAPLKIPPPTDAPPLNRQAWERLNAPREKEQAAWHDLEKALLDGNLSERLIDAAIVLIEGHSGRIETLKEILREKAKAACALSQKARAALGEESN